MANVGGKSIGSMEWKTAMQVIFGVSILEVLRQKYYN